MEKNTTMLYHYDPILGLQYFFIEPTSIMVELPTSAIDIEKAFYYMKKVGVVIIDSTTPKPQSFSQE